MNKCVMFAIRSSLLAVISAVFPCLPVRSCILCNTLCLFFYYISIIVISIDFHCHIVLFLQSITIKVFLSRKLMQLQTAQSDFSRESPLFLAIVPPRSLDLNLSIHSSGWNTSTSLVLLIFI